MTNRMNRALHNYFLCLYEAFDDNSIDRARVCAAEIDAFCDALMLSKILPPNEAWVYMDEVTRTHITILERILLVQ